MVSYGDTIDSVDGKGVILVRVRTVLFPVASLSAVVADGVLVDLVLLFLVVVGLVAPRLHELVGVSN